MHPAVLGKTIESVAPNERRIVFGHLLETRASKLELMRFSCCHNAHFNRVQFLLMLVVETWRKEPLGPVHT